MKRIYNNMKRTLLQENKVTRYLIYALGEIALVVIGILIALQVNNWNEARKARAFELTMLQEVRETVKSNNSRFNALTRRIGTSDAYNHLFLQELARPEPNQNLLRNYISKRLYIVFTYNRGAYDSLKSAGLDRISNVELRNKLITYFDSMLPRSEQFLDMEYENLVQNARDNYRKLLEPVIVESDSGLLAKFDIKKNLTWAEPEVLQVISYQTEANTNALRRLEPILKETKRMQQALDSEIDGKPQVPLSSQMDQPSAFPRRGREP